MPNKFAEGSNSYLEVFLKTYGENAADLARANYFSLRRRAVTIAGALASPGVCSVSGFSRACVYNYKRHQKQGLEPYASHLRMLEDAELDYLEEVGIPNLEKIEKESPWRWRQLMFPKQMGEAMADAKRSALLEVLNSEVFPQLADAMHGLADEGMPEFLKGLATCEGDDERAGHVKTFVQDLLEAALGGGE